MGGQASGGVAGNQRQQFGAVHRGRFRTNAGIARKWLSSSSSIVVLTGCTACPVEKSTSAASMASISYARQESAHGRLVRSPTGRTSSLFGSGIESECLGSGVQFGTTAEFKSIIRPSCRRQGIAAGEVRGVRPHAPAPGSSLRVHEFPAPTSASPAIPNVCTAVLVQGGSARAPGRTASERGRHALTLARCPFWDSAAPEEPRIQLVTRACNLAGLKPCPTRQSLACGPAWLLEEEG